MRQQDVARIAQMAPALRGLVISALPDGQLIEHWTRDPSDVDALSATLANLAWAAVQASQIAAAGGPELVTVETSDAFLFAVPIGAGLCAGFVFDRGTSLGLARVQIKDMMLELGPLARGQQTRGKPAPAVPMPPPEQPVVAPPPLPPEVPPVPPATEPSAPPAPPVSDDGPVLPPPAAEVAAASEPAAPEIASSPPAADGGDDPELPRAAKLLAYLHRYAPDPHISLLRLSLRTGISLEMLDRPEQLTHEQVESIAACVRDIVGQDQLGI